MAILAQPAPPNHNIVPDNITPQHLSQEQDMLLLAGSKLSFREIYAQELDLPLVKGKYYTAKDVDNLFVVLNGVLTSVSEQAFRNNKALSIAREAAVSSEKDVESIKSKLNEYELANNKLTQEISQLNQEISQLKQQLNILADNSKVSSANEEELSQQLERKSDAYTRLLESTSEKISEQSETIENLTDENENLKLQLQSVIDELQELQELRGLQELSNNTSDARLQSELNNLQYEYENLRTSSTERIQELSNENNILQYKYDNLKTLATERIQELSNENNMLQSKYDNLRT